MFGIGKQSDIFKKVDFGVRLFSDSYLLFGYLTSLNFSFIVCNGGLIISFYVEY